MPDPTKDSFDSMNVDIKTHIDALITDRLEHLFSYHAPTPDQIPKYEAIRAGAKTFAKILMDNTTPGADQSAALRLLREAVMTSNDSVALNGRS